MSGVGYRQPENGGFELDDFLVKVLSYEFEGCAPWEFELDFAVLVLKVDVDLVAGDCCCVINRVEAGFRGVGIKFL